MSIPIGWFWSLDFPMPIKGLNNKGSGVTSALASGIIYAANNGAKIINMSFGKSYSSFQKEVYKAMAYADSLDVLLVHAAGNDHKNIDVESNYPAVNYEFQTKSLNLLITLVT